MRRPAAALVLATCLFATAAPAAEPCSPRPMLSQHVPAFVSGPALVGAASAAALPSSSVWASELSIQTDCLRWETSLAPRAEFIGTVPFVSPAATGAAPTVPESRIEVVPTPLGSLASRFPAGTLPNFSLQSIKGSRSFSLGAALSPAP